MSAESPVAIIYDNAGNPIQSVSAAGQYNLAVSNLQTTKLSAGNSSTSNLTAGAQFTGAGVSLTGVSSIQIMCISDKILKVDVQQSTDNSNWDIVDTFLAYPTIGRGLIVQAVGSYFRVVVTNISPDTTGYLRLSTVFCPASSPLPRAVTESGNQSLSRASTSFVPDRKNFADIAGKPSLVCDVKNNLVTRGEVLTDEQSFRDDFNGSAIAFSLSGTLTFSASIYVTGNSTSFLDEIEIGDYIKLDADPEANLAIVADVISDTLLLLEDIYTGTAGSGASSKTRWYYQSGTGGSLSFTSTEVLLNSGGTPGGHASLFKFGDYLPFTILFVAKIDNRYANQDSALGFMDTAMHLATKMAAFKFAGTDNTKVNLETFSNSSDKEITTITLPNGGVTSDYHTYSIIVGAESVCVCIDGIHMARHEKHIPGPYDVMSLAFGIGNYGVVTGTSTVTVDVIAFQNFNKLSVSDDRSRYYISDRPNAATTASVSAAVADTQLAAANSKRSGITVFNDGTANLYLKLGTGASTTSFTVRMRAREYYEAPFGYIGPVHGYWDAANGAARVSEVY